MKELQDLHRIWVSLKDSENTRQFETLHAEFYPLYKTELEECLQTVKEYVNVQNNYLKKNRNVKELIEFIDYNKVALTNLTRNTNKGCNFYYTTQEINSVIPINYGAPILESVLKGACVLLGSAKGSLGDFASYKARAVEHEYFFNLTKRCPIEEPSMSTFYADLEEQDEGLTTDRDVIIPDFNNSNMVKHLPNGDIELKVYLVFDRNRPRTSQIASSKTYTIKDGVNRYHKVVKKYEQDKFNWHTEGLQRYKRENEQGAENLLNTVKQANDLLVALDTILMPISILATCIGIPNATGYKINRQSRNFMEHYMYLTKLINALTIINDIKYNSFEQMTKQDLYKLNVIANFSHRYGHQLRSSWWKHQIKQENLALQK